MNEENAREKPLLIELGSAKAQTKGGQIKNGDTEGMHNFLTGLDKI